MKYFFRRPCHIHQIVFSVPVNLQTAAQKFYIYLFLCVPIYNRRNCRRTGTCPAGQRLSRAPLPEAHLHGLFVQYFNEFRIDPLRESLVLLEIRANLLDRKVRHILQKDDGVRISH